MLQFASLPQRDRTGERTEEEATVFKRALSVMALFYASLTGTSVLQLKDVPPRPAAFDGRIVLYTVHSAGDTEEQHATKAEALRAELVERFGAVDEMKRVGENLHMRFGTHDAALRCVEALKTERRAIAFEYNTTAYDRISAAAAPHHEGHYSGWVRQPVSIFSSLGCPLQPLPAVSVQFCLCLPLTVHF